jgi:hypothetical protein
MSKFIIDEVRNCRIYGPYSRRDGRKHMVYVLPDKDGIYRKHSKKSTVSYPKWLMEQELGRILDPDLETIDHKDRDFTNNNLDNFRIIERSKHAKDDAKRLASIEFICFWCKNKFIDNNPRHRIYNKNRGKKGPFCSKSCAGKYGKKIQMKEIESIKEYTIPNKIYYKNIKK